MFDALRQSTRPRSVRVRMTAAATLVVAAAMALASIALVVVVRHQLLDRIDRQSTANVRAIQGQLASGVPPGGVALPGPGPVTGFAAVQDGSGQVVKSSGSLEGGEKVLINGTTPPPGVSGDATLDASGVPFAVRYTTVATPGGPFTVIVGSPLDGVRRSVSALEGTLAVGLPFLVGLVAVLAWAVTGRALRPVEAMRAEVEAISGGTLHRRVPDPGSGDEVSRLARTMNAMLDRLEGASTRQRQFVSDASHELRSPVAAIRTQLEVALAEPDADWPVVARKALGEEARLETLVSDLLLLASTDEQRELHGAVDVDVAALAREEAARPRRLAVSVDVALVDGATDGGGCHVVGRPDQLTRVVANLLDNACRHAQTGVRVSVARDNGDVRLLVDDDGPGIPAEDRDRVFERFTRLDPSRVRAEQGSAGLGLALVHAVVERHHGTVCVDEAPNGGARLQVTLPAAPTR
jgi:signal transduction histidine kinase